MTKDIENKAEISIERLKSLLSKENFQTLSFTEISHVKMLPNENGPLKNYDLRVGSTET